MAKLQSGTRIYGTGTIDTQLFVSGTNISTSTSTGALQVAGGVGIGGNVFVGNTATIISTVNSTSTNTGALQVRGGVGVGGNIYAAGITATNISVGIWPVSTSSFNTSTLVASAVTATNASKLVGGAVGSMPYQSSPNNTDFIPIGANGYVLTSDGTTATWQASVALGAVVTTAQGWNLP